MTVLKRQLSNICEINPRLPRGTTFDAALPVTFVPMQAVDEHYGMIKERLTRPYSEVKKGYTSFQAGDVLFAKITPCMENGKAAIARDLENNIGFGSTEFHVLRAGPEVLPEWLFYFVRQPSFRAEAKRNFTGTAGQQRVPTAFMQSANISVPVLNEQRRIVDILSRAEGIMRLQRQALDRAKALIPALFVELFGDPATNSKGWPVVTLGDVLSACDYGSSSKAGDDSKGYPVLRMGNVTYAGELDDGDLKYIELDDAEYRKYALQAGDILFNRTNSKDLVGKTGLWNGRYPAIAASYFIRLRVDQAQVTPEYVWAYMNLPYMKRVMFETARGAIGQANINTKELKAFSLPLPALNVQQEFTSRLAEAQSIITQQFAALAKSRELFDALLAQTFSTQSLE